MRPISPLSCVAYSGRGDGGVLRTGGVPGSQAVVRSPLCSGRHSPLFCSHIHVNVFHGCSVIDTPSQPGLPVLAFATQSIDSQCVFTFKLHAKTFGVFVVDFHEASMH